MERKSRKVALATVLISALVGGFVNSGPASAAPITTARAHAEYLSSIADAKASFLAAVRPSRATMIEEGKRAEVARRLTVKRALATFNSVVVTEKVTSLAAEKTYKASVAKAIASPTTASLKATVKTNLVALTKATTALSVDAKITTARVAFAKIRTTAMTQFKTALEISAKERTQTLDRASLRYKADKARALVKLQAALKKASK